MIFCARNESAVTDYANPFICLNDYLLAARSMGKFNIKDCQQEGEYDRLNIQEVSARKYSVFP
jgi:hypothetical protein